MIFINIFTPIDYDFAKSLGIIINPNFCIYKEIRKLTSIILVVALALRNV